MTATTLVFGILAMLLIERHPHLSLVFLIVAVALLWHSLGDSDSEFARRGDKHSSPTPPDERFFTADDPFSCCSNSKVCGGRVTLPHPHGVEGDADPSPESTTRRGEDS